MCKRRFVSVVFTMMLVLFIISLSIAMPILVRPFYYAHIEPLSIEEVTGHTAEEIRASYNSLLDYLTLPFAEFDVGVFRWSEAGKNHFADCKALFLLDITVLIVSFLVTVVLFILDRKGNLRFCRPFGCHLSLLGGVVTLVSIFTVVGLVALDFDRAFNVFHQIFFPGKDNWVFNYRFDEIILALPKIFFRNCAIFISITLILLSVGCILYGILTRQKKSLPN